MSVAPTAPTRRGPAAAGPVPRAGSAARALRAWTRQELLLLVREPVAVFFSLAFPVVIYLFIGLPYADEIVDEGVRFIDVIFPALVGTVAANLLLMGLPIYVAELRSRQVVKRYRALPLPGWIFATAVVVAMLSLVACAAALIIAMVATGSGLRPEAVDPLFIALNLAFVALLCPVGFLLGTLPFSARTIQALTAAVFFTLFFGSGAAAPLEGLPAGVRGVLEWNPLKIWFDQLTTVYVGGSVDGGGWLELAATLVAAALSLLVALRNWRRIR